MRMRSLGLLMMVLAACAPNTLPRSELNGNVPLLQVSNETSSAATVYLQDVRLAEVPANQVTLLQISPVRIPPSGEVNFSVALRQTDEKATLAPAQYQSGRKLTLFIKPMLSASRVQ